MKQSIFDSIFPLKQYHTDMNSKIVAAKTNKKKFNMNFLEKLTLEMVILTKILIIHSI